jgi:hypothetical protein
MDSENLFVPVTCIFSKKAANTKIKIGRFSQFNIIVPARGGRNILKRFKIALQASFSATGFNLKVFAV